MNDSSLVTSSSSPLKNTEANKPHNKRVCPSDTERSSKKQRVAHINKNNNIVMKGSVNKSSSCINRPSQTSPKDSREVSLPVKKEEVEPSTTENFENSLNGVNSLEDPEFMRKYKPITSYEQRCSYKSDFNNEREVYTALKKEVDPVSTKFTELHNKRQQFPEGSDERQATDAEIVELYEKIQKDTLLQKKFKQCQELHTKLSYIKGLVAAYDKSVANT